MSVDLAQEAQKLGVRLSKFSHWPAEWHGIVMRVLHEASRLGIKELYVKEKLGGLRVQGGGAKLLPIVERVEFEADRTCVSCGGRCPKAVAPNLPRCEACTASGKKDREITWVEP